jgi:hypothetical protein
MLLDLLPLFQEEEAGEGGSVRRVFPDMLGTGRFASVFSLASEAHGYAVVHGESAVTFSLSVSVNGHPDKAFTRQRDEDSLIALGVL